MVLALSMTVLGRIGTAQAYDLPSVNLGLTSFYDGGVPYGPGFYFQHFTQYYTASTFTDNNGNKLALPKQHIDTVVNIEFLAYLLPDQIGPGKVGATFALPTIAHMSVDDGIGHHALSAQGGVGDPVASLVYQFDPIMGAQGPKFNVRLELAAILPAGDYNRSLTINPSSHFVSVYPDIAMTYFATPDLSFSTRLHYLFNFTNHAPETSYGPDVYSVQAGQAFHGNFTAEYALSRNFSVGFNSYYLQQLTDTKFNGAAVPDRRERVVGLGPGFAWLLPKDTAVVFNAYYETLARNRPEGQRYSLRLLAHF